MNYIAVATANQSLLPDVTPLSPIKLGEYQLPDQKRWHLKQPPPELKWCEETESSHGMKWPLAQGSDKALMSLKAFGWIVT